MLEIQKRWAPTPFGLSDHTDPTHPFYYLPPLISSILGASYVEKHVTVLDRDVTRDGKVSIDFAQMKFLNGMLNQPYEERMGLLPQEFRCLVGGQSTEERQLIKKYEERWNV